MSREQYGQYHQKSVEVIVTITVYHNNITSIDLLQGSSPHLPGHLTPGTLTHRAIQGGVVKGSGSHVDFFQGDEQVSDSVWVGTSFTQISDQVGEDLAMVTKVELVHWLYLGDDLKHKQIMVKASEELNPT